MEDRIVSRKILVAVECPETRILMVSALRRWGYLAHEAMDAESVLEGAKAGGLSLILLSCSLPGDDWFDLCGRLRHAQNTAAVPLVLVIPQRDDMLHARGRQAGVDGYLLKPVLLSEFMTCLHRYMPFGENHG